MRIIVNAISAHTGGIVTYTTNLIGYLGATDVEAIIYVPEAFIPGLADYPNIRLEPARERFYGPIHRFLWEQTAWRSIIKRSGADIVFSSANYGVLLPPIKQVLLVQGEIYLNPVYRERVLPRLSWRERLSALLRRYLMLISARSSEAVIFPSQVALEAAADYGPDLVGRSVVNYLGVNPQFSGTEERRTWSEDGTLRLLYVSVYYPHKDPLTLAEASRLLNEQGFPTEARITMEPEDFEAWDNSAPELQSLQSDRYRGSVSLGRISHASLVDVLKEFDAFVFPSMAETFGFPMVEAMRAGVPLVVSDIPVHREICGDAAVYFELGDAEDLARRLVQLDNDPVLRRHTANAGMTRSQRMFTWDNHVSKLIALMTEVAAPRPLKVLINGMHARTGGGVTYLRNMLPLLADDPAVETHLCVYDDQRELLPCDLENVTYHFLPYKRSFWRVILREQFHIPILARRLGVDVTFSPANYGPFFAPNPVVLLRNAVSVGFVERRPVKLAYWGLLYIATMLSLLTCRRSIAVSEYARDLGGGVFMNFVKRRIRVIPHGVDRVYAPRRADEERGRFLLAVSDIYVQKNFLNLIKALAVLRGRFPDIQLRIAGEPVDQEYYDALLRLIEAEGLGDCVEFLGHVPPAELRDLYCTCAAFIFPSTVETFGNPLVEAMACGAPIASSKSTAMPEVLGDAGVYFDPGRVDEIADSIASLLNDSGLCDELSDKARNRSARFTWEQTKAQTLEALRGRVPLRAVS